MHGMAGPVGLNHASVLAVLDVDSDHAAAFSADADQPCLEQLCAYLGAKYGASA
jgi:putative methionine-R-sulfoxide reductase with GAF domain